MLRRIRTDQAQLGMFVERFEGSWLDHPFWRKRFLLTEPEDLFRVQQSRIETLLIDESRGRALAAPTVGAPSAGTVNARCGPSKIRRAVLPEQAINNCGRAIRYVFGELRMGRSMTMRQIAGIADELTRLVDRDPLMVSSLTRLRTLDNYTFLHSIAVSGLLIGFARHLDAGSEETRLLGMAGLLHDIGKVTIPPSILAKPSGLTPEELATIRTHPQAGYDILSRDRRISPIVLDVCRHHHRRIDGGGYPDMPADSELSRHARMAAICDVYDAVTSIRPYKAAWAPADALSQMSNWTGQFDQDLLSAFVAFLGLAESREAILETDPEKAQAPFSQNGYSDPSA